MTRTTLLAALPLLLLAEAPASAAEMTAKDQCTSAFLNEHIGPEDAAVMLRLWTAGSSGAEVSTTTFTGAVYDAETFTRAGRRFLKVRVLYQMRCPEQNLEFE